MGGFAVAGIAYCGLALAKIDFALSGTFLLSVAIITGQLIDRRTALLPVFAVVASGAAYAVSRIAIGGEDLVGFLKRFDQSYQTGAWVERLVGYGHLRLQVRNAGSLGRCTHRGVVMRFHKLIAAGKKAYAGRGNPHAQAAPRHLRNA